MNLALRQLGLTEYDSRGSRLESERVAVHIRAIFNIPLNLDCVADIGDSVMKDVPRWRRPVVGGGCLANECK